MTDPLKISETSFQSAVLELARIYGWRVFHARPSQTRNGRWITAMAGDAGFPDLVLAHPTRGVLFAELKTAIGRVSPQQTEWATVLTAAGAEYHLWRPRDIQRIKERLGT